DRYIEITATLFINNTISAKNENILSPAARYQQATKLRLNRKYILCAVLSRGDQLLCCRSDSLDNLPPALFLFIAYLSSSVLLYWGLLVTDDRMWPIWLFEFVDLFCTKRDIGRLENLLQMVRFSGADNRCCHTRRLQDPRTSDLGGRYPMLLSGLLS